MKLTGIEWTGAGGRTGQNLKLGLGLCLCLIWIALGVVANAQAVSTTTVQGTVYLANGQPGSGTLFVSWPAFSTASGQAVAADSTTVTIAADGFVSVNLAPNLGATPAGLFYTAVYYMSDGSTSTEYWVVPAAAQAALAQVQAQVMPAAQAVQAVNKAYVDQLIATLTETTVTDSGGTMTGPLYLSGDPTQPLQAADKHYVDESFALAVPLAGGNMTGPLTTPSVNGVQSPQSVSSQTTLQEAVSAAGTNGAVEIPPTYAGTDDFTNPNGIYVADLRPTVAQQYERSVKEFGAVCDGATDDTSALQAAINYAQAHGVSLTIPAGTCKTHTLSWHGESIGGLGKQVSGLMGFPGQDVLASVTDSTNLLSYTRIHDLTIYVDQSVDASCSAAEGRAPAGSCTLSRPMENNSIFSPGGSGLSGTVGTGAAWSVGNCAIAMPAATGEGGNGLQVAEIENLEIVATGVDPMAAQYPGAHSTHTCGLYLAQWPLWSEFRNIDIRGLNTGIAMPALPVATPTGLTADSNRWQNLTIQATHGFTAAAGSNNVLDNVVEKAGNSAATGEPPTGLVLDLSGTEQGWTVRNGVVLPSWNVVQPALTVTAAGGAVTAVSVGSEHGLGFDPYGTQVPIAFSGSCTATATAGVNANGSIGTVSVTSGGVGCSGTTTASVNTAGNWDTAAAVNLIGGQNMTFFAGDLLKGNGGYTVWNAGGSQSYGTQLDGGGGTLPGGGSYGALVLNNKLGSAYQVDKYPGVDFGAKLQACLGTLSSSYGGTCDARNFTGTQSMGSNLTISTANATVLLPCATISTANQIIVTAGTRNVTLRGCALRGASTASGSQGGTVFLYSGTAAMVQVGDPTYAADTTGFHLDDAVINTTAASSATTQGLIAYRTQEMDMEGLYFLGNSNQTGMTLDGTGNYAGGSFFGDQFGGFQTAVNAIGHQISNSATTDWMNASTFVRLHIDCPTSNGNPISGTYGINLQQGDGNTFTGGDVENCSTALHLGANAQNNTIVGLRNENSTNQVVADAGSSYNDWMTGGTMFTGQLTDNGTRNSFLDTFHRSFNGMNGDWYGSQKDATVTNHFRLGIGAGNERGMLNEIQTDYGYRWLEGYSDATAGEQFYQIQDLLNDVYRLSIGQYNNGQSSTNNQTVINAAGTGAVVLNGSTNSGTGGVIIGSGGATESTVATINNAGNAQFAGTLQVGGTSTFINTATVKNQLDAEIDDILWAGLTTSQKESLIYKDWNGNSQWYMVKDQYNNWALNSATGNLDSFKAYQSTNGGDTYIDALDSSGVVRINYETGSGTGFKVYGGSSSSLYASFTGTTSIMFPGLAASSGHYCLQIDNSGYVTNTGSACETGSGSGGSGTVNSGNAGQIAYYTATGTAVGGMNAVPVTAGGTGAATAAAALANLGGAPLASPTFTGSPTVPGYLTTSNATSTYAGLAGAAFTGAISAPTTNGHQTVGSATGTDAAMIQAAITAAGPNGTIDLMPGQMYVVNTTIIDSKNYVVLNFHGAGIKCMTTSDCIQVTGTGDTINQPILIPGTASTGSAIQDAGWALTINGGGVVQLAGNSPGNGQYWYHVIQVDGDEVFGMSNWNGQANGAAFGGSQSSAQAVTRCDSTFCGSALYNPPNNAGIATLNNVALTMGCSGNSIDWEGGNTLYLNNVTLQSYNQFGMLVLHNGAGAGTVVGNGVYVSPTTCTGIIGTVGNPMLNGAQGGTAIVAGAGVNITLNNSNAPGAGGNGVTAVTCTTSPCTENFGYYVVIHQGTSFTSVTKPLFLGITGAAVNSSFAGSSVTVVAPTSPNSGDTCDFLAVDQTSTQSGPIFGSTNTYAITGQQGVACGPGAGTYVTFTDTGARSSYAWPAGPSNVPSTYGVTLGLNGWFAVSMILNRTNTGYSTYTGPCPVAGGIIVPSYTSSFGQPYVTCTNSTLDGFSGNSYGNTAGVINRRSGLNAQTFAPSAIITPAWYKYTAPGLKGLYNLGPNDSGWAWQGGPTCFFTFIDSNPWKTEALPGNRPTWDAGDTAACVDQATAGLAFMDSTSISQYINHVPDNANYLERLTSTAKTFTVPVAAPGFTLNGGTEWSSSSSANSQVVTCQPGGTGTQVCDASGAWISPGSGGTVTSIATTGPVTGGPITAMGSIACPTCLVAAVNPAQGLMRVAGGTQTATGAELSGDAITNGSNAVTVRGINGTALSGLATGLLYNTTSTGVPSIATSAQVQSAIGASVYDAFGAASGLLSGTETVSGAWTFNNGTLKLAGSTSGTTVIETAATGGGIDVLPAAVNSPARIPQVIFAGTIALATNTIPSGACQTVTAGSVNSVAATNVATTDIIDWTPQVSLQSVSGYQASISGGLSIDTYPTASYINVNVCNWTGATVTPGAVSLNVRVIR